MSRLLFSPRGSFVRSPRRRHYVTGNIDERGEQTGPYWLNLMWRTFEFVDEQHDDAPICETSASKTRMETTFAMR